MARFDMLFGKYKIKFGQKFFAFPKICTPIHLWSFPNAVTVFASSEIVFRVKQRTARLKQCR